MRVKHTEVSVVVGFYFMRYLYIMVRVSTGMTAHLTSWVSCPVLRVARGCGGGHGGAVCKGRV